MIPPVTISTREASPSGCAIPGPSGSCPYSCMNFLRVCSSSAFIIVPFEVQPVPDAFVRFYLCHEFVVGRDSFLPRTLHTVLPCLPFLPVLLKRLSVGFPILFKCGIPGLGVSFPVAFSLSGLYLDPVLVVSLLADFIIRQRTIGDDTVHFANIVQRVVRRIALDCLAVYRGHLLV